MKYFGSSRCGIWTWIFMLLCAGCLIPEGHAAEKSTHVRGFERLIEAENFKGVAADVDATGKLPVVDGRWSRQESEGYSGNACVQGPGEDVTISFEVPGDGVYYFWIYHVTSIAGSTAFNLFVYQGSGKAARLEYSTKLAREKRDEPDLIYRPGFWDVWSVNHVTLKKGKVQLTLSAAEQPSSSIVDVIFVTDDPEYKPTLQQTGYWDTFMMENN